MPAHSEDFPWESYYGHYRKLESVIRSHSEVKNLEKVDEGLYVLTHKKRGKLKIFIGECYSFGVAEFHEVIENYGDVNIVLISSAWCGYTNKAKKFCRSQKVGLSKIGSFMGSLNKEKYWLHLDEDEQEYFDKKGWL